MIAGEHEHSPAAEPHEGLRKNFGGAALEARPRWREIQREMAKDYRSHFTYRIDTGDADGQNVIEHLAGVEDFQVTMATCLAARQRWPGTPITSRAHE